MEAAENGLNGSGETMDLTVQGEIVGSLQFDNSQLDGDEKIMLDSEWSLSSHLENLRLTEQTRRRVFRLSCSTVSTPQ